MSKVLVVDDEAVIRETFQEFLEAEGHEVHVAESGEQAFAMMDQRDFDVVVCDINMPGRGGIDLLSRIRASSPDIQVVIFTGAPSAETAAKALREGAFDYLAKPVNGATIRRVVRRAADVKKLNAEKKRLEVQNRHYRDHLEQLVKERTGASLLINEKLKTEIHERRRAEKDLRETTSMLNHILASSTEFAIAATDLDFRVIHYNPAAESLFEAPAGEAMDHTLMGLHQRKSLEAIDMKKAVRAIREKGKYETETEKNDHEGRKRFIHVIVTPMRDDDRRLIGYVVVARDITEGKILEHQLLQAQKLESIGQLAAGVAHEINTPTQYVGDNIRFLKDGFGELAKILAAVKKLMEAAKERDALAEESSAAETAMREADIEYLLAEIPQAIDQSLEGIERVAKIVRAMREFSHPGTEEKVPTDINKALESTVTVSRNEWKNVADVEMKPDQNLPLVSCLPGELNQAFLNILINAAHAIGDVVREKNGEKGLITVATRKDGEFAEISISDTGTGIPKEIQHRIFDPFFTTKTVGKGTGQGLAITHGIVVKKHGGQINFVSRRGKGTTFIIRIPIANHPADAGQLQEGIGPIGS